MAEFLERPDDEKIAIYIVGNPGCTARELAIQCGSMNYTARISDLRDQGWIIGSRKRSGQHRYWPIRRPCGPECGRQHWSKEERVSLCPSPNWVAQDEFSPFRDWKPLSSEKTGATPRPGLSPQPSPLLRRASPVLPDDKPPTDDERRAGIERLRRLGIDVPAAALSND